MAADLTVDLAEAEADGGSAEDVLGNSAFDPRRFAAAWAVARGVTAPPTAAASPRWRPPVAIALTVVLAALTVLAGLVLLGGGTRSSIAVATRRIVAGPGPNWLFGPGPRRVVLPGPLGPFIGTQISGPGPRPIALAVLIVGLLGLVLLAVLYWRPASGARRYRREGGGRTPSWH
jgi:hypothetical protein